MYVQKKLVLKILLHAIIITLSSIAAQTYSLIQGNVNELVLNDSLNDFRTCPGYVDSCLYICDDGTYNPCHPQNIYTIAIDTSTNDEESTAGSRYRIYFPWVYEGLTANKFTVTASWPCLSPTAVYASGDYAFWDIYGNSECPGTVQGSIWYGQDCEDEYGNIGSNDCLELVGRFCFASGDTLNWDEYADQSISTDTCDDCWMSSPAWSYYSSNIYSDSLLYPEYCEYYDHCHHSYSDSILCGVGYMDGIDTSSVSITEESNTSINILLGNYPNPFNSSTKIYYEVPSSGHVKIDIIDINGRLINTVVNNVQKAGTYVSYWDGKNKNEMIVPSGVYMYVLKTKNFITSNKLIILK